MAINDDEADQAVIDAIRARGPRWIPDADAQHMMDQIEADAEAATALQESTTRQATNRASSAAADEDAPEPD